ncbi:MAG: Membrane protein involved in the export of O-antigen and teichoic acid-like protein [Actinobacteria bacterium]|nr:Membrane protein involved in the export of O-antigen and teichoic acid-like protein [Actinomycetota bacterium]
MANRWAARTPSVDSPAPEAPLKAPDKMPMRLPSHRDPVSLALAPLRRLREDWRDPLLRNGYALIINVGATSVLGLLYWVLAARLYSPAEVGVGNAAISLMQLLAGIGGQLTFAAALARFIPRAGGGSRRLAFFSYLLAGSAGVAVSLVYIAVIHIHVGFFNRIPAVLGHSWLLAAALGASVTVWCLFALQDAVLTGIRQAVWIPVENGLYGVVKIGMLVALAHVTQHYGIFTSFTLPAFIALFPTNYFIFRRLLPRHMRASATEPVGVSVRSIRRFMGGDYLGTVLFMATGTLLPVLILARLGKAEAGYFASAYLIIYALDLVTVNLGVALMVEGAMDRSLLRHHAATVIRRILAIIGPAVAVLVLFAPRVLGVFGHAYAVHGSGLLRLLAVAVLAKAVTSLYIALSRVERRVGQIAFWQAVLLLSITGLSWWLMGRFGIDGVGLGYLVSQVVVAFCLLPSIFKILGRKEPVAAGAE